VSPAGGVTWDHVALGTWDIEEVGREFGEDLGGVEIARFTEHSWQGIQLAFAGGIRLEVLQPVADPRDDFLPRFLQRSGPGPHHVTFKVADIKGALEELGRAGIEPTKVDLSDPNWQEAFLHPKLGLGTVVQLAQPAGIWAAMAPDPPPPSSPARADFLGAEVRADIKNADRIFGGLLDGSRHDMGGGAAAYSWPGAGTLVAWPAGEEGTGVERLVFRDREGGGAGAPPPGERPLYDGPARIAVLAADAPWPAKE
jgi:methylmalonyl-CoA/ethylmalonyl-CoA epimerase